MAIELVARNHLKQGDIDGALNVFSQAAVHGSTHALTAMSTLMEHRLLVADVPEEKVNFTIEALALLEVARLRGDDFAPSKIGAFKQRRNFNPSADQMVSINAKAQAIYEGLEKDRTLSNLSPFNNTSISEVKKLVEICKVKSGR